MNGSMLKHAVLNQTGGWLALEAPRVKDAVAAEVLGPQAAAGGRARVGAAGTLVVILVALA